MKQKQLAEAQKRLGILKKKYQLMDDVVNQFKQGTVFYSERQNKVMDGILYWVSNVPEYAEAIEKFEKEYDAVVYHATLSHTEFGDLLSLFHVSKHKEEWKRDNADLEDGYSFVYVKNLTDETCSEFGTIGFKGANGGLSRTQ